jgi:hypothetical protein
VTGLSFELLTGKCSPSIQMTPSALTGNGHGEPEPVIPHSSRMSWTSTLRRGGQFPSAGYSRRARTKTASGSRLRRFFGRSSTLYRLHNGNIVAKHAHDVDASQARVLATAFRIQCGFRAIRAADGAESDTRLKAPTKHSFSVSHRR